MNQTKQGGSDPKTGTVATGAPFLVLKKLDKRFGATHALKAVDLTFEAGEIHAIVGENGAGKSTLIKLFTGVHVHSSGGINAVHQEVVLCPHLTVECGKDSGEKHTDRRIKPRLVTMKVGLQLFG